MLMGKKFGELNNYIYLMNLDLMVPLAYRSHMLTQNYTAQMSDITVTAAQEITLVYVGECMFYTVNGTKRVSEKFVRPFIEL